MSFYLLSILVILFASFTHCDFVYAQKTGQEEKSQGSQELVAVPQRSYSAHCPAIEAFEGLVGPPPFKGQFLPSAYSVSNGRRLEWAVEVFQLWQNERQEGCFLRQMWRYMGQWNTSRYSAEIRYSAERLDWQSSAYRNWEDSSASSRSSSRRQPTQQNQTHRRKKKRGQPKVPAPPPKGRGKGKKAAGRDGQPNLQPLPPPPAPPPWPTLDSAALLANNTNTVTLPPVDSNTLAVTQQLQADNREFARLLRDVYPDVQSRPPEAAAAIDRAEQGMKKSVTKSLHVATKALDRAQKLLTETAEARRIHRNSWLAHLTESIP